MTGTAMSISDGLLLRNMLERLEALEQRASDDEATALRLERLEQRVQTLEGTECSACVARRAGDAARQRRRRAIIPTAQTNA
jgi:hypothetical protein